MMENSQSYQVSSETAYTPSPYTVFEQPASAAAGVVGQGEITAPVSDTYETTAVGQSDSPSTPTAWRETVVQSDIAEAPAAADAPRELADPAQDTESGWLLDQEMADSLQAESSDVSPRTKQKITETIARIKALYETDYGAFMQPASIEAATGVEQRVFIIKPDAFDEFCNSWERTNTKIPPTISGGFSRIGNVILLKNPKVNWDYLNTQQQQKITERFGEPEKAKEYVCKSDFGYAATHELAHQYEADDTPLVFSELGACYYQKTLTLRDGRPDMLNSDVEVRAAFYRNLLDAYGDDVHRVFFGTLNNPERQAKILSHLTPENIKKLYLNGDGWGHEQNQES